jgi:hypothetical protein
MHKPAVVVDEVEDLHFAPASKYPVRHVGLPAPVGEWDLEAHVGGLRSLPRLVDDHAAPAQDAHDSAHRGSGPVATLEVHADGLGPGVEAFFLEVLAQQHDLVLEGGGRGRG